MNRLGLMFFLICIVYSNWASAQASSRLRAILVGVGNYENSDGLSFRNLKGPPEDVAALRKVLEDRFRLKRGDTTLLTDGHATRKAIMDGVRETLSRSKNGDVLLFYFSGHGSRIHDKSNDEPSGYDDTLIAYDSRDPEGKIGDITDDELGEFVSAALSKGVYPVVILDSCHSGTGIRFRSQPRYVPEQFSVGDDGKDPTSTPGSHTLGGGEAVMLAAAGDSEVALESERDGIVQGEFTRALVKVLTVAEGNVTYLDVLTRVRAALEGEGVPHHPQGEGPLGQNFLKFGPVGQPPLLAVSAGSKTVRLSAGAASGVTRDSEYAFFATAADAGKGTPILAMGKVDAVSPSSSVVLLASDIDIPSTIFALETAHAFGSLRLPIALDGGNEAQRASVLNAVNALDFVDLVPDAEATYWLRLSQMGLQITRLDGSKIGSMQTVDSIREGGGAMLLGRLARYKALLELSNPAMRRSPIRAGVVLANDKEGPVSNPPIRGGEPILTKGQIYRVVMFNGGNTPQHVYLLNLDAEFCVRLISPPPYGKDEPLIGSARTKRLVAPDTAGREYFVIISAERPISVEPLQRPCLTSDTLRGPRPRVFDDPLAQLLMNAAATVRGPDPEVPTDGWATELISLVVE
ncbi:caspase family protein [Rhizobium sp. Leaf383]|uniref:caspase family protein n=1 Tax=Rhizobium sp. Leaf383 TaxID=1736357 RepID=UPI0007150C8E|nr:caspase family protein [Rhizobium sp. Leaf383]KQS75967.1 hypothetical protein ASG58_14165 [Rhizobium sp. Leaf383]